MSQIDKFNLCGIFAQLIGFVILAWDLWPEYKKAKRKQMILWMVGFCRHSEFLFSQGKGESHYYKYATYKEAFMASRDEIAKHLPQAPLKFYDDFCREEDFKKFYAVVKEHYKEWISNIDGITTFRSMYVGEAIFIIIFGYALQILSVFINADILKL